MNHLAGIFYPIASKANSPCKPVVVPYLYLPISGTDNLLHIFLARRFGTSTWRGTASTFPVAGFVHKECDRPSRLREHP